MQIELTYDEAALVLECSPRHVRNIIGKNTAIIQPIRYSYHNVRLPLAGVIKLKKHLRTLALGKCFVAAIVDDVDAARAAGKGVV